MGKWFSTLQWDTNQPFKRQQDPKLPPNPSMPADRRERARLQHSRADDASWLGDEKAQRSLEAEQAVTRNTEAEEPVKAKLKLTADGRLPAPQPVRFVSEDGDHRSVLASLLASSHISCLVCDSSCESLSFPASCMNTWITCL